MRAHICLKQNGLKYVRKYDDEDWNHKRFRKTTKLHPFAINIWMMISYEREVEKIKWASSKTWINEEYFRNNVFARYVLNDERLKIESQYRGKF